MRAAALAFLCAGCLSLPDRPGPEDGCRDGAPFASTFDSGQECLPWGTGYGNAVQSNVDGRLRLAPRENLTSGGGCFQNDEQPLTDVGLMLEVTHVMPSASGYVTFLVEDGGTYMSVFEGRLNFAIENGGGLASVDYDADAMRWWRMRPDRERDMLVGEYSPNGFEWTTLGESPDLPQTVKIKIEAGTKDLEPDPGFAEVDNLNSCEF